MWFEVSFFSGSQKSPLNNSGLFDLFDKLNENGNTNFLNCSLFKTTQLNY